MVEGDAFTPRRTIRAACDRASCVPAGAAKDIAMANSFFTGTDAELYTGSESFSTKISATPTAYGLTAGQATAYAALNATYAAAYLAATDPATRTKGQVAAKNSAREPLQNMASDLAKIIEGTPSVTDQQKIDLGLNVRKVPAPKPAPGTPGQFRVELFADGTIEVGWKCQNPAGAGGTMYQIWRRIGASGEFTYLGGTGNKKWHDQTIPAGSSQVTYKIQAVRSTAAGAWVECNVNFGVSTSGQMTASVTEGTPVQLAA